MHNFATEIDYERITNVIVYYFKDRNFMGTMGIITNDIANNISGEYEKLSKVKGPPTITKITIDNLIFT